MNEINNNPGFTPQCLAGVDTQRRVIRLEQSDKEQWIAISHLRHRLPTWATAIISLLTFLLGCSVTWIAILRS
jgi:hypothetical protein